MASAEASIKNAKKAMEELRRKTRGCVVVEVESCDWEGPNFFACFANYWDGSKEPCRFDRMPEDHRVCPYNRLCTELHLEVNLGGNVVILEEGA